MILDGKNPQAAKSYSPYGRRYLGRYELRELLGRGWMGEVYRAVDPERGQPVAVKLLHQLDDRAENAVARFQQAVQTIAALDHPHIIRVFDFGVVDDVFYVTMELLDGQSVRDLLSARRGGLPQEEAVPIAVQVADALAYAHARGVIHGDVQPSHILFAENHRAILTDFSLAHALGSQALTGTPAYLSPEQAAGSPPTALSDLYSLGVVLYEMTTGRLPFLADDDDAMLQKHLHDAPVPPREAGALINAPLEKIILRALAKDPSARFHSANEMKAVLEAEDETGKYDTFILKAPPPAPADDELMAQLQAAREAHRQAKQEKAAEAAKPKKRTGPLGGLIERWLREQDEETDPS